MADPSLTPAFPLPQEALLAAIVESSYDAIIGKSLDGVIVSWNAAAERLFGYAADEAIGRPVAMLVPSDRQREEPWILERLRQGVRIVDFETVRVRKDGARIQVSLTSSPLRGADGRIVGASKIVRDLSVVRAAAAAVAESEARLAAIVDSAMDAVVTVDETGRIVVFNDAAAKAFGCARAEAVGGPLSRFLPERFHALHDAWMRAFGEGETVSRRMGRPGLIEACRADGGTFPAEASISHCEVHGRQLYTVILRDVSERECARSRRAELESQLREAQKMEAVGTLAGGIAHDFNNVIGAVLANAGLARQELAQAHPARPCVEQIELAANRARAVVRQLLAFCRHQPQELLVQPLAPLLGEAIGLLRATLPSVVALELRPLPADVHARVDANQIHQVIINLCTNAWHALRSSSGRIELALEECELGADQAIALGELSAGRHALIQVRDDGCGMDAATVARIFEPFFTTKPRGEGTGLGLAVVHGIVRAHDGAIQAESAPGRGTTFRIWLPAAAPLPVVASGEESSGGAARTCSGQRVAIIDDDEVMLLVTDRLLRRCGFDVTCFRDPLELIERVRRSPGTLDAVVSDFNMPAMSGIELARALAGVDARLPVILSSGYVSDELRSAAAHAGVRALLEKENTFEELCPLLLEVAASA